MKNALIFSGQGTHYKGMCASLIADPAVARVWENMKERMMCNFGVPLQDIILENPKKAMARSDAFDVEKVCKLPCTEMLNTKESEPRTHAVAHEDGVMQYTFFTQPCVLAVQLLAFEKLRHDYPHVYNGQISCIAGHSLGEFTALASLGVFSPETAVDLVFKRGLLMEEACKGTRRGNWKMYACNPQRAQLSNDKDHADQLFFATVDLVAQALSQTSSFVEIVNYNLRHQQYVVAGDLVGLAVLGKCLDPQFRANCEEAENFESLVGQALASARADKKDGVATDPNKIDDTDLVTTAMKKYGSRSTFRRFLRGADDGYTPSLEELTHLTLQEDGRSGLKKKSWFIPLGVEVPFHSSKLRPGMDQFLSVVRSALPDEAALRDLFSIQHDGTVSRQDHKYPLWVTNLTGKTYDPLNASFQTLLLECMERKNVGEVGHNGRYDGTLVVDALRNGIKEKNVREITATVLAAQFAHPVQWISAMDELVLENKCTRIQELSPQKNMSELLKREVFVDSHNGASPIVLTVSSYPKEHPVIL